MISTPTSAELWMQRLVKCLRADEGVRTKAYDDATGKEVTAPSGRLTIGVGRNIEDNGISEATISQMLQEDIECCLKEAQRLFGLDFFNSLSTPRQHAIIMMIFQLGAAGFFEFRNTIAAIKQNNFALAAEHARKSLWARQVPDRAKRVTTLLESEVYLWDSK